MEKLLPALLAFLIAAVFTALELTTSKYPRTIFLIGKCRHLYVYVAIYGLLSFGTLLGLDALVAAKKITLEGIGLESIWVKAVIVGLSTKALLHISLYNLSVGAKSFPLGTETIVQLFEPWLLEEIFLFEFNEVSTFIAPRRAKYPNLVNVKTTIKGNLPAGFTGPERLGFEAGVEAQVSIEAAMETYLRRFGKTNFTRVFPV
jgi:hypothetical protein